MSDKTLAAAAPAGRQSVYDGLMDEIRNGRYRPGERLPNERDLAQRFALGRGAVRGAMARLETEGIVERKVGCGTFLRPNVPFLVEMGDAEIEFAADGGCSFYELIEARLLFEPEIASLAASKRDPAGVARMERRLARLRPGCSWLDFKENIYAFHKQIYAIAGNRFLLGVFDAIHSARRRSNYDGRNPKAKVAPFIISQAEADLRPILAAIKAHDGEQARELTRSYLLRLLAFR